MIEFCVDDDVARKSVLSELERYDRFHSDCMHPCIKINKAICAFYILIKTINNGIELDYEGEPSQKGDGVVFGESRIYVELDKEDTINSNNKEIADLCIKIRNHIKESGYKYFAMRFLDTGNGLEMPEKITLIYGGLKNGK